MTIAALSSPRPMPTLDFTLIRRVFGYLACACAVVAPFTPEPAPFMAGAAAPWLCLRLVGTPTMPAAVMYLLLWQWLQIFARVPQTWIDGDTLATGLYGPNVVRAYWYMLASLVVMAAMFRAVLGGMRPPTPAQRTAHFHWQIRDLVLLYMATMAVAYVAGFAMYFVPGLAQPMEAVVRIKVVALFMLFTYVMSTGRGAKAMIGVVLFEVASGFTGFLSDFRGVFIYLAVAAVAARVRWTGTVAVGATAGLVSLLVLALFWTSVKTDYRGYVTGSSDSQQIVVPLSERMGYLGSRALAGGGEISLADAAYMLLARFAYVDIFGAVIDMQETAPEAVPMRQWTEAFEHVLQPRFLFPDKAPLSDSEVYLRLTGRAATEELRLGTSISVGYMGENYADFGFPGMLAGVAVLGVLVAGCIRLLMSFQLPLMVREGIVMAMAFSVSRDGVEVSLPKILGALLMFVIVFLLLNKFAFPKVMTWLSRQQAAMKARPS
jgi:hypothetical protein